MTHLAFERARILGEIREHMPENPILNGWASYSRCDEDGIIAECLRRIEGRVGIGKTCIEVGCADGLENNTHQLMLDGYRGVWVDGDPARIQRISSAIGQASANLLALPLMVDLSNAGKLALRCSRFLGTRDIDVMSLDIDGNDLAVALAMLEHISPKILCLGYNAKFRPPLALAVQYGPAHIREGDDYFGASLQAWVDALAPGFVPVCCNISGTNAFFARRDIADCFVQYPLQELYQPPRYWLIDQSKGHKASLKWLAQAVAASGSTQAVTRIVHPAGMEPYPFAVHAVPDQYVSGDIIRDGTWEPLETELLRRLCLPGDHVLDLGANIGWYSVLFAKCVGEHGRVDAFEPDHANAQLLDMNLALNDVHSVVDVHRCAVAEQAGVAALFRSDTNLGDHRIFDDGERGLPSGHVETVCLDDFLDSRACRLPDILKSDTQGSEGRVLRGARRHIEAGWRPVMVLEFWPFGLTESGEEPKRILDQLLAWEYELYEVSEGNGHLRTLDLDRLFERMEAELSPANGGFINLLCMPKRSSRRDVVAQMLQEALEVKGAAHA